MCAFAADIGRPKLSIHISAQATEEELTFAQQLGVDCAYIWVRPEQCDVSSLTSLRQRCEDHDVELYMAGNMVVGKCDKIHLALPGRDEAIAEFQQLVTNLGQAGIPVTTLTWESDGTQSSEPGQARGARARRVSLEEMARWPLSHGRIYSEDELWDNFAYFMERIMPVAESAGVRLALHPNDPPTAQPIRGIPPLIRSVEAYRRAYEIADSPALGMEFCCGCWLEGGKEFGDLLAGIREFQLDNRILIVHFRNITSPLPVFTETLLDDGYMDMSQIMRTLVEAGYRGSITLDHSPQFIGDYAKGGGAGYGIGYMKALLKCLGAS